MAKINVLVFPAGEINSIELHDALSTCVNIELYGASSIERHGKYVFKNYISGLPMINDNNFISKLNDIINNKMIDVIFPTHDTIAEYFAANQDKINCKIIVANKDTSEICRDKTKTFDTFKDEKFCPKIFEKIEQYPIFIKPRMGQGSVGAKIINGEKDIPKEINIKDYVICEYLPGEEYTIDCFTDKNKKLTVLPRSRKRVFSGVSVAGQNENLTEEIIEIAETINKKLNFNGLWFFQVKKDSSGSLKLLEISTRCAGGMCLSRAMGVNLPLLSVYDAMGYDIEITKNNYNVEMDRTLITRYNIDYQYDKIYLDFDDTLIINSEVNLNAIRFLYQCKNKGKKVILVTRHNGDLEKTFEKYALSKDLFSEIIKIDFTNEKSEYIIPEKAIFIDNSHVERAKVKEKHKIPVFDADGIEVLLDWRN